MARENNFLLGNGERLTYKTDVVNRVGDKNPPYDFETARLNVSRWLKEITTDFSRLPSQACPNDEVIALFTMHPRYISKSEFPKELLESVGLRAVGGKSCVIKPRAWGIERHPEEAPTDEYFIAGKRSSFVKWANEVVQWNTKYRGATQLQHLEKISSMRPVDKLRAINSKKEEVVLEVVLHDSGSGDLLSSFQRYANTVGAEVAIDWCRTARGVIFAPVRTAPSKAEEIAKFSFVRVIREMPKLRLLTPSDIDTMQSAMVNIPYNASPISQEFKVAIFDGGIPKNCILNQWVKSIEPDGIGPSSPKHEEHGVGVTSALLFGPITGTDVPPPLCHVDHIRVIDVRSGNNGDFEYYDVLDRILKILDDPGHQYDFVNISLGPNLPIDDDEITRWTSSLDERLTGDKTVATVAVGNGGAWDPSCGNNRVQPPADGVNVLAIGATDSRSAGWKRASYSCVGPGRCPGFVKPDAVIFGGSSKEPFYIVTPGSKPSKRGVTGTSYAAPYALRTAVALRAQLGKDIRALAIRAVMIHRANMSNHNIKEVGWGCLETDFLRLITCDDDEALVIYQDSLPLGQYLRAPIPFPEGKLPGYVTISATLVIAPEIDPAYPNAYTRGGLEVVFRPDTKRFKVDSGGKAPRHPQSKSFFNQKNLYRSPEYELRQDAHKWETCLKATQRLLGKSLDHPCFDIYYHHRGEGTALDNPQPIPYALVVSIKAPKVPNLYDQVVRAYAHQLVQLRPQTKIQIST